MIEKDENGLLLLPGSDWAVIQLGVVGFVVVVVVVVVVVN